MKAESIRSIIDLYTKHGWKLRRVLISVELKKELGAKADELFAGAGVAASDIDAAWFTRDSRPGVTAWEIRQLTPQPFALVEGEHDGENQEAFEARLRAAEDRIRERHFVNSTGH